MVDDRETHADDIKRHGSGLGEAVSRNGVDVSAARREHLRELTMARQAAERRHARPALSSGLDRATRLVAAQERATELRVELERIDSEHRTWLHDHGEHVPELRSRQRVLRGTL
jgi:hypothetical protein